MKERPRRTLLERLALRHLDLYQRVAGLGMRVPGLRTLLLRLAFDYAYAAQLRRDLELAAQLFYDPDAVLNFPDEIGPDYERRYEGREELFAAYRRWLSEWEGVRRDVVGFVDRGEHVVVLAREHMRGESSGLEVDREVGQVYRLRGAVAVEHWEYRSWAEALAHH
jgi:hypothetical protein